jgi:hypothetical protein
VGSYAVRHVHLYVAGTRALSGIRPRNGEQTHAAMRPGADSHSFKTMSSLFFKLRPPATYDIVAVMQSSNAMQACVRSMLITTRARGALNDARRPPNSNTSATQPARESANG